MGLVLRRLRGKWIKESLVVPGGQQAALDTHFIQHTPASIREVQASTPLSDTLSKALKKRGFRFVGSTICYAFLQAAGLVNDHTTDCFRHGEVAALSSRPL